MKKIVLTGGGTAGHVMPNLALLGALRAAHFEPHYIGSHAGLERGLATSAGTPYYGISAGKLRRYWDLKNATDVLRVVKGLGDARAVLRRLRPCVVFSKGGFVTVPVVLAAYALRIPVVVHESDITPGLANRLTIPFARAVCCSFPETLKHVRGKGVLTGTPIRADLFRGSAQEGRRICGFNTEKPAILVMGGSQGAAAINRALPGTLPDLLTRFNVIHLCGKGNRPETDLLAPASGYAVFEYAAQELAHLLALAEVVVSRAGANSIFEFLALGKPNLLIPLPLAASRGDQILNAASFQKQGFSMVLPEEDLTPTRLHNDIFALYNNRAAFAARMAAAADSGNNSIGRIVDILQKQCKV